MSLWKCFWQNCFWPLLLLILLGLVQMFWPGGEWRTIEEDVRTTVTEELKLGGFDWAEVETHDRGRDVLLSGTAPSEEAKSHALTLASQLAQDEHGNPVARIVEWDGEVVVPAPEPEPEPIPIPEPVLEPGNLSFSAVDGNITLNGVVASDEQKQSLIDAANATYGATNVVDRLTVKDNILSIDNIGSLVENFALSDGTLRLSLDKVLKINGEVNSNDRKSSISQSLQASLSSDYSLDNQLTVAIPDSANLSIVTVDSKVTVNGTIANDEQKQAIIGSLNANYGAENVVDNLVIGENTSAINGVGDLAGSFNLPNGAMSLSNGVLMLTGEVDAQSIKADIGQQVQSKLSSDYSLDNQLTVVVPDATNFSIVSVNGKTTVNGTVANDDQKQAIIASMNDNYGASNVVDNLVVGRNVLPVENVGDLVGRYYLVDGSFSLSNSVLTLTGEVDSESIKSDIGQKIQSTISPGYSLDNQLTIKAPDLSAICQEKVRNLMADSKIFFAVNKADIKAESYPLLDQIGLILNDCLESNIQVAGHTDSTGSAEINQPLSQSRAQAVVAYLISKGVNAARLSSAGFGSEQPIADNATSEGRAANRRIEFTVK